MNALATVGVASIVNSHPGLSVVSVGLVVLIACSVASFATWVSLELVLRALAVTSVAAEEGRDDGRCAIRR